MDAPLSGRPSAIPPFWGILVSGLISAACAAPWVLLFTAGTLAGTWEILLNIASTVIPTALLIGISIALIAWVLRVPFWLGWVSGPYAYILGQVVSVFTTYLALGPEAWRLSPFTGSLGLTVGPFVFGVLLGAIPPVTGALVRRFLFKYPQLR